MAKLKSEGKCAYCDEMYSQSEMGRHLTTHLEAIGKKFQSKGKAFHLKISAGEMFLHLLVDGSVEFEELDDFLRAIWLECCGHMSSFRVKGKEYDINWEIDVDFGEKMSDPVYKIFKPGLKVEYEYDFGSTTYLDILVVNEYKFNVGDRILLLSRNEPLPILCHSCREKPAITICSIHLFDSEALFCPACAKKHEKKCPDFEDYAAMPVVNSPRMGVCGYVGGQVDKARDGAKG
jgi:hypothetical protein